MKQYKKRLEGFHSKASKSAPLSYKCLTKGKPPQGALQVALQRARLPIVFAATWERTMFPMIKKGGSLVFI